MCKDDDTILFEEKFSADMSSLSLTSEVAAIPKLRMAWWFVHGTTCAMAAMAGSCTNAAETSLASPWGASTWELERMWKVISPWNSRLDDGHCSCFFRDDFLTFFFFTTCLFGMFDSVQISCPGVSSSFVPRRTTNRGRARFEHQIMLRQVFILVVFFSWGEFMWWFNGSSAGRGWDWSTSRNNGISCHRSYRSLLVPGFRELRGEAPHISTLAGTAEEHSLEVQRASLWLCGIPNKDREFKDLPDAHIWSHMLVCLHVL